MSAHHYLSPNKLWQQRIIRKIQIQHLDYSHIKNHEKMTPRQIIWHLMNNINDVPKCSECNDKVNWHVHHYRQFCSNVCSNLSISKYQKMKQTKLERYGDENYVNQEKAKQTNLERYGVENPQQSDKIRNKTKQTMLEKHGVENPQQSKEIREKSKQTCLEKYGVEYPTQSKEIQEKTKQTCSEKYGVIDYNQLHFSKIQKETLFIKENFEKFMEKNSIYSAAKKLNVDRSTIQKYIEKYEIINFIQQSYLEIEMEEFLKENNINFIQNTRKIITPYELDFYLPDHNLAIEMNGDYWHSNKVIYKRTGMTADEYHQMKTDRCHEKGIDLVHISESEWNKNQEIILKNHLCSAIVSDSICIL